MKDPLIEQNIKKMQNIYMQIKKISINIRNDYSKVMSNGFNEYYWKSKGKEIVGNIESLDNFIKYLENNLESYEKNGGDMTDDMICKIQELFKKTNKNRNCSFNIENKRKSLIR